MNLYQKYLSEVIPEMKKKFGYKNDLAVPKIKKVVINVGLSRSRLEKDQKFQTAVEETLLKITGQKPVATLAKKSISGFKIRQGQIIGLKVTLRKKRMYDFLEKLINVALPRTRDFWGINPRSVDKNGNLSVGFREQIVFPEIRSEAIEKIHGLEVTITTTAKNREEGIELFKLLGFPFIK